MCRTGACLSYFILSKEMSLITISRSVARQVRSVLRRAGLMKGRHGNPAALRITAGAEGICLAAALPEIAVEYREPGDWPPTAFVLPVDVLASVEGRDDSDVTFLPQETDSKVIVRWTDRRVPKEEMVPRLDTVDLPAVPPVAERWEANEANLVTALRDAMATRDPESARFALGWSSFAVPTES
jgi:hypothetical protein